MARMARLLRSVPELLIIVRAIAIALRSVFFLMVLLVGLVYVFALLFNQLFDGKNQPAGPEFANIIFCIMFLLAAVLPESLSQDRWHIRASEACRRP